MTTITTVLVSGQNAHVGSVSSRGEYSVSVNSGVQGPAGANGVGITAANVVSGNLVLTYSNSAIVDVGTVVGANGAAGPTGANGATGATGPAGANGVSVVSANVATGNLIITLSNSAIVDAGNVSVSNAAYLGGVAAASYLVTNTAINTGNVSVTGNITLTGNLTGNTAGFAIGYLDVPQNYTNTSFTIALTDRGKHIYTANGTSQTITIANNSSVAFPIGSAISIVSQGAGTITVARGTGVTLYLAANNTNADRTIASYGMATILKVATDTWFINGAGVT